MMRKHILLMLLCGISIPSWAQYKVNGVIKGIGPNNTEQAIGFASVYWMDSTVGTITDAEGNFLITRPANFKVLVAKALGYKADTVVVDVNKTYVEFKLNQEDQKLNEVVVAGRQRGNVIQNLTPLKTEVITAAGLCKMACCNLAESFENTASVSVGYSDAVSGARQIKMLGLAGTYTQMLDENRPVMRGIASPYGLTYTPGQWLESIQISKGPGTVVNGYESVTGQINVEHRKPASDEKLFVNLYLGEDLRREANVTSALKVTPKLSTITLVHASVDSKEKDHNKDGFVDLPATKQINVANRWLYLADNGIQFRAGVKALAEQRVGGQMNSNAPGFPSVITGVNAIPYRSEIDNKQFNGYFKLGVPLMNGNHEDDSAVEANNIALVGDYSYHAQEAFFGLKQYEATMNSYYLNLLYDHRFSKNHKAILGASFRQDNLNEILVDRWLEEEPGTEPVPVLMNKYDLGRIENIVGAFGEYTFTNNSQLTLIAGARIDHNSRYGWLFTPRANLKWDITPQTTLRASGGRGFRSGGAVSDNIGILATGRRIVLAPELEIEDAWTFGASLVQYFRMFNDERASLSLDVFSTDFSNQLIVDQESNPSFIQVYNLKGDSYTQNFQVDLNVAPMERFSVFMTYRYTIAKVDLLDLGLVDKPLVDRFKSLVNLQYSTRLNKWTFDYTFQINGQTRLPDFSGNADALYSEIYPISFGQVTRKFKKVDVYVGCENIGDYTQKHPIISAESPFSPQFNSSVIWGPLMGRKVYAGLRYTL
jgi:outer membrane receptor for ferrienterochelin and colicin